MIIRPMKGVAVEDYSQIRFPVFASPKIDGFRCMVKDRPLTSRLSPFPNPYVDSQLSGLFKDLLLDGEIVVGNRRGKGVLQRTSSGVTSKTGEPDFTLWAFDTPQLGYDKSDRLMLTQQIVADLNHPRIKFLRHRLIYDQIQLEEYIEDSLDLGYEGVMVSSPQGIYKFGKSTLREQYILKIKPFETAEGRIKDWFEEEKNNNEAKREATGKLKRSSAKSGKSGKGTLGGFILEDIKTSVEVRVGGGFSKDQREKLWKIRDRLRGKLVRYKKQTVGEKDKPRHPNFVEFVDFRPEWDMTDD